MANLYLTEQGAVLRKSGDRVVVSKDDRDLLEVPCHHLDAVLIFGNVHFTTPALRKLLEHGIELAFLSRRGRLLCQLTPPMPKNVILRMAQYDRSRDDAFALSLARTIVAAKIHNGAEVVRRHAGNHPNPTLSSAVAEFGDAVERAQGAGSLETLLGVEGAAAKRYFSALAEMVPAELEFRGRNKRPPRDPVNALLSLGYTLLTTEIASLADGVGLDPHVGFLHRADYGRPSLATDIAEEFRAPVIDRLTLSLFNRKQFGAADFFVHAPTGGVHLRGDALKRYLLAYDRAMGEPGPAEFDDAASAASTASVRGRLRAQLRSLVKTLEAGVDYDPLWL